MTTIIRKCYVFNSKEDAQTAIKRVWHNTSAVALISDCELYVGSVNSEEIIKIENLIADLV